MFRQAESLYHLTFGVIQTFSTVHTSNKNVESPETRFQRVQQARIPVLHRQGGLDLDANFFLHTACHQRSGLPKQFLAGVGALLQD